MMRKKQPVKKKGWGQGQGQPDLWFPLAGMGGSYDVYGDQPEPSLAELIAAYEDVVFACVNLIANNVASVEYKLVASTTKDQSHPKCLTKQLDFRSKRRITKSHPSFARKAQELAEVVEHPLLELLDRPNRKQSFHQLISLTQTYLELTGSAFWWLVKNAVGYVDEIWLLPSQNIRIKTNSTTGEVESYENNTTGQSQTLLPDEILHLHFSDPMNPYAGFGVPPVRAVWQKFQLLRMEQSAWQAILSNAAQPSAVVFPPEGEQFSEDQATRIGRQISERFRMGNQGGVWVVQDNLVYQPLATPPKDLSALQLYDQIKTTVCNAYAVPRAMLDLNEANYASADTAKRSFQEHCLEPRIKLILEAINHRLCPPRLFLTADNVVEEDKTFELQNRTQAVNEYTAGLRTLNEARELLGLDSKPGGDRFQSPIPSPTPQPQGEHQPQEMPSSPVTSKAIGGRVYSSTLPDPKPMATALGAFFAKLGADVQGKFVTKSVLVSTKDWFPLTDWTDEMRHLLTPYMRAYFDEGSGAIFAALGGDTNLPLLPVLEIDRAVNGLVLALCQSTLDTTNLSVAEAVQETRDAIATGLDKGEADIQLMTRIKGIFADLSERHSMVIAETESSRAKHSGELFAIKESGIAARKKWLPDSMACDKCLAMAAKGAIPIDELWTTVGTGAYSKIDHPPYHCSCRCSQVFELGEE